jgi:hypothetical protein
MNFSLGITSLCICVFLNDIISILKWPNLNYLYQMGVVGGGYNVACHPIICFPIKGHATRFCKSIRNVRGDYFLFHLVFIKKITKSVFFFLEKNWNRTGTGSNQSISVQFG